MPKMSEFSRKCISISSNEKKWVASLSVQGMHGDLQSVQWNSIPAKTPDARESGDATPRSDERRAVKDDSSGVRVALHNGLGTEERLTG